MSLPEIGNTQGQLIIGHLADALEDLAKVQFRLELCLSNDFGASAVVPSDLEWLGALQQQVREMRSDLAERLGVS